MADMWLVRGQCHINFRHSRMFTHESFRAYSRSPWPYWVAYLEKDTFHVTDGKVTMGWS